MGKSELLRFFQYRCLTVRPRTPVSLVSLDNLLDFSPLALVQRIAKDLAAFSIKFETFETMEIARAGYDFTTIKGSIDMRGANLRQAQKIDMAGTMYKVNTVQEMNIQADIPPSFTMEQQIKAQEISIQAFLNDLSDYCSKDVVVIILDAFEKCPNGLQHWLKESFLEHYYFNFEQRPQRLLLVVAGQELPDFELRWPIEDCKLIIKSVRSLSKWTASHVEECLQAHGFRYTQRELETFCRMIEIGLPPSQVVEGMQSLLVAGLGSYDRQAGSI